MGLLDDAIREHLELKRRSGADPGAIAQAEHEALDPIFPEEPSAVDAAGGSPDGAIAEASMGEPLEDDQSFEMQGVPPDPGADYEQQDALADEQDFSNVGQETAELDMQAVLDEDLASQDAFASAPAPTSQPVRAVPARSVQPEGIDRQPAEHADRPPAVEEIPGQERLSFE